MERFGGSEENRPAEGIGRVGKSMTVWARPWVGEIRGFPVILGLGECRALFGGVII